MKRGFVLLSALVAASIFMPVFMQAQTGNAGIGTTGPTTKLDINGALTTRESASVLTVGAGPVTISSLTHSQFRLANATAAFTITGPTLNGSTALVAGARMIIVNATTQIGTLNGFSILPGAAQEFAYTGGGWVAANGGVQPDYDWMKAGNQFPNAVTDTSNTIYHIGGSVGIGTNTPHTTLHVQASADSSLPFVKNIVARFDPQGGSNVGKAAAIGVNGGRAILGYEVDGGVSKYAFIRGNQSTDIRLQVVDAAGDLYPKPFFVQGGSGGIGYIGINHTAPQSQLDVRGTTKILADTIQQTGSLWTGTSNLNGFEVTTTAAGDAWAGIQRAGNEAPLHLSKPAGTTAGSNLLLFAVGGGYVGSVTYNGSGVTYNTISDFRLKENIRSSHYGLSTVKAMQVYDYNFKTDRDKNISTGLMAQDLYKLYPQAVTVGGDNAATEPWQVDYSKLTPVLIKAVQELNGKMEKLEQTLQEKDRQIAELQTTATTFAQLVEEVNKLKQCAGKK